LRVISIKHSSRRITTYHRTGAVVGCLAGTNAPRLRGRDGANAVLVADSPETFQNSTLIAKLLGDAKLPAIFAFTESVEAGGLMAYSFDLIELYKRAANTIDAILRGASPGDIPFYQVTKFELSINLKTAKQLGLSVPLALVASADKVIE
jgi:putative tryptophan/tyrosine transport system substrate-binding protein